MNSMSIALRYDRWKNYSQSILARDGVFNVYVNTSGGPIAVNGGNEVDEEGSAPSQAINSIAIPQSDADYIRWAIATLDSYIAPDFRFVSSAAEANIDIHLDSDLQWENVESVGSGSSAGVVLADESGPNSGNWEIIGDAGSLIRSAGTSWLSYFYVHEIGHVMGLEHPFNGKDGDYELSLDPLSSVGPDFTVMSYKPARGEYPNFFTSNDLSTLIDMWGAETAPSGTGSYEGSFRSGKVVTGGVDDDIINGGNLDDRLTGGFGSDTIYAGRGRDWISSFPDGSSDNIFITTSLAGRKKAAKAKRRKSSGSVEVDVIEDLGPEDRLFFDSKEAGKAAISVRSVSYVSPSYGEQSGLGIYLGGALQAVYIGGDLSGDALRSITSFG